MAAPGKNGFVGRIGAETALKISQLDTNGTWW
jgi:hypothetical protein